MRGGRLDVTGRIERSEASELPCTARDALFAAAANAASCHVAASSRGGGGSSACSGAVAVSKVEVKEAAHDEQDDAEGGRRDWDEDPLGFDTNPMLLRAMCITGSPCLLAQPMAEPPRQDPDIASRVLSGIYELACSSGRGEPMPRAVADLLEQRGVQPADARAENWKRVRQLQTVSAGATPLGEALGALDRLVASLGIDDASEALVGLRVVLEHLRATPASWREGKRALDRHFSRPRFKAEKSCVRLLTDALESACKGEVAKAAPLLQRHSAEHLQGMIDEYLSDHVRPLLPHPRLISIELGEGEDCADKDRADKEGADEDRADEDRAEDRADEEGADEGEAARPPQEAPTVRGARAQARARAAPAE
ncbi:hypothetical protein EMIHUDRAFT_454208, partial [Emiliania huxleyi CCMP1516]|uniref:Uncharacterized protein n=2 Tax=Emiliania huxleyi TaxID=2903 RepID=A0A0D3KXL1_EMIH1